MKVALINKNPAVARLITLSLNKIGVSYIELDDASLLDQKVDFVIVDSDVDVSDDELSAYATKVMHLIPRGAQKIGEICLEKPFLPTEFIAIFEQNKPQDNVTKDDKFASDTFVDADNLDINLDDFELPDLSEPSDDDIDDLGLHLNSEAKIDDGEEEDSLDLNQMSFDENDEQKDPQGLEREKVDLNELTELQEMAPMDISLDDEATSDDESIGSILDDIDAIKDDELPELPNSDVDAFSDVASDDEADDIEQIKSALDEIDSNDSVSDELARLGVDGTLDDIGDEILKDDIESVEYDNEVKEALMSEEINPSELSIADEKIDIDDNSDTLMQAMSEEVVENEAISDEQILGINELDDENLGLDENDSTLEPESEDIALELDSEEVALELDNNEEILEPDDKEESLESQEENLELDDAMDLMASDKVAEISQDEQNTATFDSIDDIDENSMMSALGLAVSQSTQSAKTTQKPNNDIKAELEQTITKHLMDSLDDSSIKDALKGMNIKINISFEEK